MAQFSQMQGGPELAAVLRKLPDQLARNALSSTALTGARTLQSAAYTQLSSYMASRAAQSDDVVLKKRRTPREPIVQQYDVGPPTSKPWLRWLHNGTKPHIISALVSTGRRSRLRTNVSSRAFLADKLHDKFFGVAVNHPGQPPRPWLTVAQWQSRDAVFKSMADQLRVALAKQARRLASTKYTRQQFRRIFR